MNDEAPQAPESPARGWLPSAPFAISVVALVLACVGTAAAIQANSVRSKHIVNGQVKAADLDRRSVQSTKLADGAVRTGKLADDSVRNVNLEAHSVTAAKVAPGSLTGTDLLDGTITTPKLTAPAAGSSELAGNAVSGPKVIDGSLSGTHFASGSIGSAPLGANSVGPAQIVNSSLTGADFNESTFGSPMISKVQYRTVNSASNTATVNSVEAECPAGKVVIGGGGAVTATTQLVALFESAPISSTTWRAIGVDYGDADDPWRVEATVICAEA